MQAALVEFNLSRPEADFFVTGVKTGGLLFFIRTEDEKVREAAEVLRTHKAEQVMTTSG